MFKVLFREGLRRRQFNRILTIWCNEYVDLWEKSFVNLIFQYTFLDLAWDYGYIRIHEKKTVKWTFVDLLTCLRESATLIGNMVEQINWSMAIPV